MTQLMGYAARFGNVPRALELLRHHPDGMDLGRLAIELGVAERKLREELTAFYLADVSDGMGVRQSSVDFLSSEGDVADADAAPRIRLSGTAPLSELGVELLDAQQLALLYRAAWELSSMEPDNDALARAVDRLGSTLVPTAQDRPEGGGEVAGRLRDAVDQRRRVEIVYARSWEPGVTTRVIEPYRVVSTRHGYEVDAAALDRNGDLRTFLVSGIREVRVLDETFEPPADVDQQIARNRATVAVTLVLPIDREWVAERFAERVEPRQRDDDDVEVVVHIVPPVAERVGLMTTIAGPGAFVTSPPDLVDAAARTARELLRHHGLG